MLDYDPNTSLLLHPLVSTARYGVNPFQENLFRIVSLRPPAAISGLWRLAER